MSSTLQDEAVLEFKNVHRLTKPLTRIFGNSILDFLAIDDFLFDTKALFGLQQNEFSVQGRKSTGFKSRRQSWICSEALIIKKVQL